MYIYTHIYTFGQTALWDIQILKTPLHRDSEYIGRTLYMREFCLPVCRVSIKRSERGVLFTYM